MISFDLDFYPLIFPRDEQMSPSELHPQGKFSNLSP